MKTIICELRRVLCGRWFYWAALGTTVCLWLGMGSASWRMIRYGHFVSSFKALIQTALTGQSSVLSLPALAALPAASVVLQEIQCGAMRTCVFRVGRRRYRVGKLTTCVLGAMLSQILGTILFVGLLYGLYTIHGADVQMSLTSVLPMLATRLLASAAYACFGAVIALCTNTSASAYVAPTAACFTLKLLGSRFFIGVPYVDPSDWLAGGASALALMLILCVGMLGLFDATLGREMAHHA